MRTDAAFELIRHAHQTSRFAHAYLIVGEPRGPAGELAVRILQMLFCTAKNPPCGACDRCRQVAARTWADAFWVEPEKKSRIISIDALRYGLLHSITQTSLAGGWKAGVILGADCLKEAAANAFLKTLEEPPPQTIFLLLTNAPHQLLSTVVSRCQRVDVSGETALPEDWPARVVAILSAPTPAGVLPAMVLAGRLKELLNDVFNAAEKAVKGEAREEADEHDADDDELNARISARYREWRAGILQVMLHWYRDLLLLRAGGNHDLLHHLAAAPVLAERAARLSLAQTLANVDGMEALARQMDRSMPEESLLAYWLDRLAGGVAPAVVAKVVGRGT